MELPLPASPGSQQQGLPLCHPCNTSLGNSGRGSTKRFPSVLPNCPNKSTFKVKATSSLDRCAWTDPEPPPSVRLPFLVPNRRGFGATLTWQCPALDIPWSHPPPAEFCESETILGCPGQAFPLMAWAPGHCSPPGPPFQTSGQAWLFSSLDQTQGLSPGPVNPYPGALLCPSPGPWVLKQHPPPPGC